MTPPPGSSPQGNEANDSNANPSSESTSSSEEVPDKTEDSTRSEASSNPGEIRLAKFSVTRTGHGMAMDILAGKLRVRLYIGAQWTDLVETIAAGEEELNHVVPFRMAPLEVDGDASQVTPETLGAQRIPELSSEHPLFGTPLWNAIFPSDEPPSREPGLEFDEEPSSSDNSDNSEPS